MEWKIFLLFKRNGEQYGLLFSERSSFKNICNTQNLRYIVSQTHKNINKSQLEIFSHLQCLPSSEFGKLVVHLSTPIFQILQEARKPAAVQSTTLITTRSLTAHFQLRTLLKLEFVKK